MNKIIKLDKLRLNVGILQLESSLLRKFSSFLFA